MARKPTGRPPGRPRHKCDGTAADYRRHKDHGETPCIESNVAHALMWRRYRRSRVVRRWMTRKATVGKGLYVSDLRGKPGDDYRLRSAPPRADRPRIVEDDD